MYDLSKVDYKKTSIKIAKSVLYVFLAGLAALYSNESWYIMLAPLFHGLENVLKHSKKR